MTDGKFVEIRYGSVYIKFNPEDSHEVTEIMELWKRYMLSRGEVKK